MTQIVIQRQLSAKEKKSLEKQISGLKKSHLRIARFTTYWTLLSITIGVIAGFFITPRLQILLAITTIVFVGIGLWIYFEDTSKSRKRFKEINDLKNRNSVTSIRVSSDEFYQSDEEEDEGVHYLFQIRPDKILFFGGQEFYPNKEFPNSDFEIVEGKSSNGSIVLLEVYCFGEKITPKKKISGEKKWELLGKLDVDAFHIIDGNLGQV